MPDFFMDRLINLPCNANQFTTKVSSIVERKGGSVDGISQTDQKGGNAVNVASALLALGVQVTPIICTSKFGLEQILFHLKSFNVDFSHIKTFPKASATTALEFQTKDGKVNVMIRDLGSLADFASTDLTETDYRLIEQADWVCLFNWAGTLKHGTELAQAVFTHAKAKGKCRTYLDTADPVPNKKNIAELMEKVLKTPDVDVLSLNENEAVTYASLLSNEIAEQRGKMEFNKLALLSAQVLSKNLHARIDLHTTTFAVSVTEGRAVFVPAFKVKAVRATGAGDAWDAGNLFGGAYGLSDECRLTLANAVAACYLSDSEGGHPSRQKLTDFLQTAQTRGS
ncbi:MAG: carbohydrate kinase family protein [Candidatus Bathyarchaeota archaeon]|nr:carbohydrate kinase family protein [Candidatus Bathyarchaeota archaeon]